MHVMSFVLPGHIGKGDAYKYLKIEQKGENLHCELNKVERELLAIKNVPKRYLMMVKKVENKLRAKKKCSELAEKSEKTIPCMICDKTFLHQGAFTMHSMSHHI